MNKVDFRLPVEGRWLVFWGGDTKEQNIHHSHPIQKYAFDMIRAEDKIQSKKNISGYKSFGCKVFVPADGEVVEAVDGVRDNKPGNTNTLSNAGNYVLIKHVEELYSLLAHFKQDSIKVRAGNRVKTGDLLGLTGNSGNSTQPHLHFHLQSTENFFRNDDEYKQTPIGTGIKCYFSKLVVEIDGQQSTKLNYSPIRGEIISQA